MLYERLLFAFSGNSYPYEFKEEPEAAEHQVDYSAVPVKADRESCRDQKQIVLLSLCDLLRAHEEKREHISSVKPHGVAALRDEERIQCIGYGEDNGYKVFGLRIRFKSVCKIYPHEERRESRLQKEEDIYKDRNVRFAEQYNEKGQG